MDQYWKLVNVDKRQTIPRVLAKMIEILGNRDAKAVIPLLRVPKLENALASNSTLAKSRAYKYVYIAISFISKTIILQYYSI